MPEADDLREQLRAHVLDAAAPVTVDEVQRRRPRRPARTGLSVAAAVVVLGAGVALVVRNRSDESVITAATERGWPAPFGVEVTAPPTPAGWVVIDLGEIRLALPPGWVAPVGPVCAGNTAPSGSVGLVYVGYRYSNRDMACRAPGEAGGSALPALPPNLITITEPLAPAPDAKPATVGTFQSLRWTTSCGTGPAGCVATVDFLSNGYALTSYGPDVAPVLATVTDSGSRRVLQEGPTLSTRGWRSITRDGVRIAVPHTWTESENPFLTPGLCLGRTFDPDRATPLVQSDDGIHGPIGCDGPTAIDVRPADGAFLSRLTPSLAPDANGAEPQLRGRSGRVDVAIFESSLLVSQLSAVLRSPDGSTVAFTLGVGLDPAVARTILRSIRAT